MSTNDSSIIAPNHQLFLFKILFIIRPSNEGHKHYLIASACISYMRPSKEIFFSTHNCLICIHSDNTQPPYPSYHHERHDFFFSALQMKVWVWWRECMTIAGTSNLRTSNGFISSSFGLGCVSPVVCGRHRLDWRMSKMTHVKLHLLVAHKPHWRTRTSKNANSVDTSPFSAAWTKEKSKGQERCIQWPAETRAQTNIFQIYALERV